MEVPTWVDIVKTASYKELAPYDPDWFYIRAASMARKLYVSGNMGVGAFRKNYGGAKNDGVCRYHHAIGSGSVARAVLKQLEAVGVVEKGPKGRRITPSGQRDLDRIAGRVKVPSA
jgi:small subunit ribosomal protein S19e|tara:strand:- start:81 stop:428 length:348 start_codon:yes stop_codon:yes gene_type:complete